MDVSAAVGAALLLCLALQTCTAQQGFVRVKTAQDLRAALTAGTPHIQIVQHLDLRKLPTNSDFMSGAPLFYVPTSVLSIQV